MPVGGYSVTVRDNSRETSSFSFHVPQLSAINIDDYGGVFSTALMNALDPLITGNVARHSLRANTVQVSSDAPANVWAQRELKWEVPYTDDVSGLPGSFEIPTADLTLLIPGTDLLDTANAAWDTFRDLIELRAVSNAGNPITLGQPKLVGRNL